MVKYQPYCDNLEMRVSLFICPLCQSPLQPALDTWRCDGSLNPKHTNHPFDVARQGYVNLLLVQQKKSKAPGDSQMSIDARKRFLNAGHYQPLQALIRKKMTELLAQNALGAESIAKSNNKPMTWLDIGCGEGYYTQAMVQTGMDILLAADISKPAVVELAKASKAAGSLWYQKNQNEGFKIADGSKIAEGSKTAAIYPLVNSAANLPLRAHSVMGISSIFSPILPEVFNKVLSDEGYLIIAKPDVGHLATMRNALFDDVREHDSDKFLHELAPYFALMNTYHVSTEMTLSVDSLADLMTMTPYAYRARSEKRQALLAKVATETFTTEAKFVVYVLQKIAVA